MIEIQNTNKDLLAKLMATEDINVLHKNVPTAYFDVKNRTLVCPSSDLFHTEGWGRGDDKVKTEWGDGG